MASGKIRGITIELSADASGVLDAVKDINKNIKTTTTQLKDVDKLLKFDPGNMTLLTQKTQKLQEQIGNTKEKLDTLKQAQADMDANGVDKNSEQYQALQREIIATEQELKRLEGTAGSGSAALAKISVVTGEWGQKMEDVGKKLSIVSAGLVALGTAAVKAFNDVDEGADIVIKKTGATGDAADALEKSYKNVASGIVADFTDIGAAVGDVSTRFQLTGDNLEDLSTTFLQFADINGIDVTSAVEGVDHALKTFNVDQDQANNVMGLLSKTSQDTGISMDELLGLLQSSGPTLKELGLDLGSSVKLMGNFESAGLDSSEMLGKLQKAATYYNEKGLDMNEGLSDLIARLQDSSTEADATAEAYEIFGKRGGLAFITAAQEGKISIDDLSSSLGDYSTVVSDTYEATLDGTDKMKLAWQNMQLGLGELGEAIGNTLAPVMDKITAGIQNVTEWFGNLDEGTKETIVTIGAIVAAIGPLLVVGGKVMKGISSITSALSTIGTVSMGPIGLAIAAVAALSAAGIALFEGWKNAYKDASPFTDALEDISKANDDLASSLENTKANYESQVGASEANAAAAQGLYGHLMNLIAAYDGTDAAQLAIQGTIDQLNQLVPGLGLSWDSVTNSLNMTTAEVYANIEAMRAQAQVAALQEMYTQSLKDQYTAQKNVTDSAKILKGVMDEYGVSAYDVFDIIADGNVTTAEAIQFLTEHGVALQDAQGYTEELCGALTEYLEARQNQADADETVTWAEDELSAAMAAAAEATAASKDTIIDSVDDINNQVDFDPAVTEAQTDGAAIGQELASGISSQSGTVATAADGLANDITGEFTTTPSEMNATGSDSGGQLASGITGEVNTVQAALEKLHGLFNSTLRDVGDIMQRQGNIAGQRLSSAISGSQSLVTSAITVLVQSIRNAVNQLPAAMYSAGNMAGQGLYNGLAAWQGSLSALANSIANSINAAARRALQIKSPSRVMMQVGEYTGEGLQIGLEESIPGIMQTAKAMTDSMVDALAINEGMQALNAGVNSAARAQSSDATNNSAAGLLQLTSLLQQFLPYLADDKNIYFEDGTWAGKLAPAMNRALNDLNVRSARG